jgi:muramoyltetrapeptide carboxypeptidase
MIQTVIGGFNSGELLPYLDYDLIRRNPKIVVGYSDITALSNAIYSQTGLVTYSGPHFFDFGEMQGFDYTLEYFRKCLFSSDPFDIWPSERWSSDRWGAVQDTRNFLRNEGYVVGNEGKRREP